MRQKTRTLYLNNDIYRIILHAYIIIDLYIHTYAYISNEV